MNRISGRAKCSLLLVAILVLGVGFFLAEYVFEAGDWITFPGSPHVYSGGNLDCGVVTDRAGTVLLDSTDGRSYSDDPDLRKSTIHLLGDRYGYISAPALSGFSSEMVGFDPINGIYSMDGESGNAVLTISADAQLAALDALDGRKGVVGVYNYKTGEILCAVTSPNYDPDNEPDIENDESGKYEGVYLNRFTQVSYVPGSIFKVATTAAALSEISDIEDRTFHCDGYVEIEGDRVDCSGNHGDIDLEDALMQSCNSAYAQLAIELGPDTMTKYIEQFHLTEPVTFDGITTAKGHYDVDDAAKVNVGWSGIGQYTDLVNPCRYMVFMGQIAGGGTAANPHLVQSVSSGPLSSYKAKTTMTDRIMPQAIAAELQELMHYNVVHAYGEGNFPDIHVCGKSGTAQVGGDLEPNATFSGFSMDEDYPLAFIVMVENGGSGSRTCVPILSQVLPACMDAIDETR